MSDEAKTLRWGVLGTGFISLTMIEAIARSDGSEVTVVAGRNPERLAELCRANAIPRSAVDVDEVFEADDVDVVYVGLPNHLHHDATIAAAAAGKAVLSEKSLTTTMATADQLVARVRLHGTFFVEGLMYLAHPLFQRLTDVLLDGRLGRIRSVRAAYAADIAEVVNPRGGGTIYNLGCYPVSLLHLVVQVTGGDQAFRARSMTGLGSRSAADGNVVDAALTVRFDDGVLASLQSSDSYGNGSEFSISGDHGVLRFETNPWLPVPGVNAFAWQPFDGPVERIVVEDANDAFYHQVKMVERSVAEGRTEAERPSPRLSDSIEIMEMLTEWEALCLTGSNT